MHLIGPGWQMLSAPALASVLPYIKWGLQNHLERNNAPCDTVYNSKSVEMELNTSESFHIMHQYTVQREWENCILLWKGGAITVSNEQSKLRINVYSVDPLNIKFFFPLKLSISHFLYLSLKKPWKGSHQTFNGYPWAWEWGEKLFLKN